MDLDSRSGARRCQSLDVDAVKSNVCLMNMAYFVRLECAYLG